MARNCPAGLETLRNCPAGLETSKSCPAGLGRQVEKKTCGEKLGLGSLQETLSQNNYTPSFINFVPRKIILLQIA